MGKSKDYTNQYGEYIPECFTKPQMINISHEGLSRTAIFNAVEQSLERLQTSYIDVLHIHRYDESVPPEETMRQ